VLDCKINISIWLIAGFGADFKDSRKTIQQLICSFQKPLPIVFYQKLKSWEH
jgi:hypothetical protein